MTYYFVKLAITGLLIVTISEISKRNIFLGGLLASLPLVSYLALIWFYVDTKDVGKTADLSVNIFWLVLPSLVFFPLFSFLLRNKWNFYASLGVSTGVTICLYFLTVIVAKKAGFQL